MKGEIKSFKKAKRVGEREITRAKTRENCQITTDKKSQSKRESRENRDRAVGGF